FRDSGHNARMSSTRNIHDRRLADAWATLKAHADTGQALEPDANRLAFADPEFLLRRETRGIRFQLELLKPDLEQQAHGIENTIVVFGSARLRDTETSAGLVKAAETSGDEAGAVLQVPLLRAAQDALHDAREGPGRLPRRLRHARRAVRGDHLGADPQGAAGPDRTVRLRLLEAADQLRAAGGGRRDLAGRP